MTHVRQALELVRAYLADQTIGCPVCDYNLRGATSDCCPECGTPLSLNLTSFDTTLWPWMIMPLSIALPLGFFLTLLMFGALGAWRSTGWRSDDVGLVFWMSVISLGLLALLRRSIRKRGEFMRHPRREQWVRAWCYAGGILVLHGFFVIGVVSFS